MEHIWLSSSSCSEPPPAAIEGGYDCDGTFIYVGRCHHEGYILPAKVIPNKGCAYVTWDGKEYVTHDYEILLGPGYGWKHSENGSLPHNAVRCSDYKNCEPFYIGRGYYNDSLTVGKVHPSHACLYIPFDGEEIKLDSYEVLVQADNWLPVDHLQCRPPGAVQAGYDADGFVFYVARAMHEGTMLPAKYIPAREEAYVAYKGCEIKKSQIEVLSGGNYCWIELNPEDVAENAVMVGRDHSGEPLFVGRAYHNNNLTPGVVSLNEDCVLIPFGGSELRVENYEVLMKLN